jgi:predicted  nucleic acid-binding Zn-ribbon protein
VTDTPRPAQNAANIDLDEVARRVEALEHDLAQARTDSTQIDALRAEVEQLRALLGADEPAHDEVQRGLSGLSDMMHKVSDELISDAFEGSRHLAQIGRLLGM